MGVAERSLKVIVLLSVMLVASQASAETKPERAAIIAIDLGGGAQEFMRPKALASAAGGLTAAGFEVIPFEQATTKLSADLVGCRQGPCLASVGKAVEAGLLVVITITRKDESTIIVMRLHDAATGEMTADIHEVCDLCGQSELGDRIDVAASALRAKAKTEFARRAERSVDLPRVTGRLRVGIVPGIAVNVDNVRVDALAQDLADALSQELEVETVGGLEVRRRLPAEGIPLDCINTPTCVKDVAKRLDAHQLLFVVMVDTGANGAIQIDTTWVDPRGERSATRRPIDIAVVDQARQKFAASAPLLLPDAPLRKKDPTVVQGPSFDGEMSDAIPRHVTRPAMIAGGIAIAGLGIGVGFGIAARSSYNDCEASALCPQATKDSLRTKNLLADVGFGLAVAGAVTASILYATSGKESRLVVGPTATPDGTVGFLASGRF
jgi:hypothetical protein